MAFMAAEPALKKLRRSSMGCSLSDVSSGMLLEGPLSETMSRAGVAD